MSAHKQFRELLKRDKLDRTRFRGLGMEIEYFHIDSFTTKLFSGNPAGVCLLKGSWPNDALMKAIAGENGLPETAFVLVGPDGHRIRWFTPDIEMDLCGHATLAAAYAITGCGGDGRVEFKSRSGTLAIEVARGLVTMRFPVRVPAPAEAPRALLDAVNANPAAVLKSRDWVFVYPGEDEVRDMRIDRTVFDTININPGGLCVTAPGRDADFVSRFFTPQATILEDPVTGSAHCSLVPYWAKVLGKPELTAMQLSARGGTLYCALEDNAVVIAGHAVLYKKGVIHAG